MIALDAMGGDNAPDSAVEGAVRAAKRGVSVALFGDKERLVPLLNKLDAHWRSLPLEVEHCTQEIAMGQEAGRSVVAKRDSSLVRAVRSVQDGTAVAVVSAGNSGAALVAGTLIIGRAKGIMRPAIGDFIPTHNGSIFCIDLGANTDPKAIYLEQFAKMGHAYVQMVKNISRPRIALLSNGSEPYKGSSLVKQAYRLLEKSNLHFVGNVESRDIFNCKADVLVCDGFVGNIMLKSLQGTAGAITHWLKREADQSWLSKLYLMLGKPIFDRLRFKTDYKKKGGALLLGLQRPFIIAHGCSTARAFEQALVFADHIAQEDFIPQFNAQVASISEPKRGVRVVVSQKLRSIFGRRSH